MALLALLGACTLSRYYSATEQALATDGHFSSQGHIAVYYPGEIALDFPGYVVGIELTQRTAQIGDGELVVDSPVNAGATMTRLADELRDGTPLPDAETFSAWGSGEIPVITQILRYRGNPLGAGNCALYSLYQTSGRELMDFCDGPYPQLRSYYHTAYADSWSAVQKLKSALFRDAESGQFTHLIVAMMGWRTTQEEAIRNFNSLVRTIVAAGQEDFRPLFVGITWAAPWGGRWIDPIAEAVSYPETAELADTIGLTWLGVITDEIVLPLSFKLPTSFLTHSFGARAALTAVCIGPLIHPDPTKPRARPSGAIDRFFGFEAALSLKRFTAGRLTLVYEHVKFPNHCDHAKSIVLTTSRYDSATRKIVWADFAGNYRYYRSFCRSQSGKLASCASVDASGVIEGQYDEAMKILYLDASELIRFTAPGTEGGAHSDIFRLPTGRLIWSLIAKPPHEASAASSPKASAAPTQ
jgi:hypothetical protein